MRISQVQTSDGYWIAEKRNAVPVLATLVLLSYTTLLQSVLTIFSSTQLDETTVWLADGNVLYAKGKHISLLIVGFTIMATFIFPFTSVLLLSPWLQAKSHWKGLRCMIRVNHLLILINLHTRISTGTGLGYTLWCVLFCMLCSPQTKSTISVLTS